MKKVNFIDALSPQKQYEIRRWFLITIFLCCIVGVIGFSLVIGPYLSYCQLRKEVVGLRQKTKNSSAIQNEHSIMQKEHDLFQVRKTKIDAYHTNKKNQYDNIASVIHSCDNGLILESIKANKNEVEIALTCLDFHRVYAFVKELEKIEQFNQIKIISAQRSEKDHNVRAVIKGKMVL